MKRITAEMLVAHHACSSQVELFERVFPRGAPVSMRSFTKASKAGLSSEWTAQLLSAPAWAEYEKVCDTAWADREKVCDTARAKYQKVCDTARAEYEKVHDTAWAEYEKVRAPAQAEYEKVYDTALVAALRGEEETRW